MVILLIISFLIIAYFVYQVRRLKMFIANPESKSKIKDNSNNIYENPGNVDGNYVVQEENEQSTYTALKRPGKDENDDHVYCGLNEVHKDNLNQKETGNKEYMNLEETGI